MTFKQHIEDYIRLWESRCYYDGIPDKAPARLEQLKKVPSYRTICRAILKNDTQLSTLGYEKQKCEIYHELKKIELGIKDPQLKIQWTFTKPQ